jgi:uncharacterized delta-60 repeat protein
LVRRTAISAVITFAATALVAGLMVPRALAEPGGLDPFFDGDGRQTAFIHGATGYAVAIDPRGRILVAGYTLTRNANIALARFLPNGSPDPSFGNGVGRVSVDLGGTDYAFDIAIQDDHKIVVAGERDLPNHSQFAVARFGPGGVLDASFSGDGKAFVNFGTRFQGANALAIGPGGKILIGGFTSNGSTGRWAMARFRPDGTLDPGFGGDGKVTTNLSASDEQIEDLLIQPGGSIVAAGYAEKGLSPRFAVARYGSGGRLDGRFGSGGTNLIDVSRGGDIAYGIAERDTGGFLLVGYANHGGGNDWGIVGLGPRGHLDGSFGDHGRVITAFGPSYEYAYGVAMQPNGRFVVVGRASRGTPEFCVVRYKAGGSLDPSFSGDGKAFTDFFGGTDTARAVALQSNGKIVVAGEAEDHGVRRIAVARYLDS